MIIKQYGRNHIRRFSFSTMVQILWAYVCLTVTNQRHHWTTEHTNYIIICDRLWSYLTSHKEPGANISFTVFVLPGDQRAEDTHQQSDNYCLFVLYWPINQSIFPCFLIDERYNSESTDCHPRINNFHETFFTQIHLTSYHWSGRKSLINPDTKWK